MAANAQRIGKIEKIVRNVLSERFENVEIESISVVFDVDEDGDDILRVKVIFDGQTKHLDARKASGVLRHLRPKIAEIGEDAFPIMSYIAKSELGKHKTEAA